MHRFLPLVILMAVLNGDELRLLTGIVHTGDLVLDGESVRMGGIQVPLADCDALRFSGEAVAIDAPSGAWLADGGWLPMSSIAGGGGDDRLLVTGPLGAFDLPLLAIRGFGAALPFAAPGADAVLLPSGLLTCRVRGIVGGELVFTGDLGELNIPLGDVTALRLGGEDRHAQELHLLMPTVSGRPALALLPGSSPRLAVAPAVGLTIWPRGVWLRVEGPRRVYLSGLEPAVVNEEGGFGKTWNHRKDAGLEGGAIHLGGVPHDRGLSLHSRCELRWKLDARFLRLHALVGIADEVRPEGNCPVVITGDGKALWQRERVTGKDQPDVLDLDVTGIRELVVTVEFGERFDIGDRVTFADAWLLRR